MATSNFDAVLSNIFTILKQKGLNDALNQAAKSFRLFKAEMDKAGKTKFTDSIQTYEAVLLQFQTAFNILAKNIKSEKIIDQAVINRVQSFGAAVDEAFGIYHQRVGQVDDALSKSSAATDAQLSEITRRLQIMQEEYSRTSQEIRKFSGVRDEAGLMADEFKLAPDAFSEILLIIEDFKELGETTREATNRLTALGYEAEAVLKLHGFQGIEDFFEKMDDPAHAEATEKVGANWKQIAIELKEARDMMEEFRTEGTDALGTLARIDRISEMGSTTETGVGAALFNAEAVKMFKEQLESLEKENTIDGLREKIQHLQNTGRGIQRLAEDFHELQRAAVMEDKPHKQSSFGVEMAEDYKLIQAHIPLVQNLINNLAENWKSYGYTVEQANDSAKLIRDELRTMGSDSALVDLTEAGKKRMENVFNSLHQELSNAVSQHEQYTLAVKEEAKKTNDAATIYDRLVESVGRLRQEYELMREAKENVGILTNDFDAEVKQTTDKTKQKEYEKELEILKAKELQKAEAIKLLGVHKEDLELLERIRDSYFKDVLDKQYEGSRETNTMEAAAANLAEKAKQAQSHPFITDETIQNLVTGTAEVRELTSALQLIDNYMGRVKEGTEVASKEIYELEASFKQTRKELREGFILEIEKAQELLGQDEVTLENEKQLKELIELYKQYSQVIDISDEKERTSVNDKIAGLEKLRKALHMTTEERKKLEVSRDEEGLALFEKLLGSEVKEIEAAIADIDKQIKIEYRDKTIANKEIRDDLNRLRDIYSQALKEIKRTKKEASEVDPEGKTAKEVRDLEEYKEALDRVRQGLNDYADLKKAIKALEAEKGTMEADLDYDPETYRVLNDEITEYTNRLKELDAIQSEAGDKYDMHKKYVEAMAMEYKDLVKEIEHYERLIAGATEAGTLDTEEKKKASNELRVLKLARKALNKETKLSAEEERKAAVNADRLRERLVKLADSMKRGTISFDEANKEFKEIEAGLNRLPMKFNKGITKPLKEATSELAKYKNTMSTSLSGWDKILDTMSTRFGYFFTSGVMIFKGIQMVTDGFKEVIKYSLEYEKSLANLRAIVAPTTFEFVKLDKAIREASLGTTQSTAAVADAATAIGRLGYNARQVSEMIGPITLFTQATMESTDAVAELLGATLRSFDLHFSESKEVLDLFAQSVNRSAISFNYLQNSMKIIGPVAKAINLPLKETLGYMGIMANAGLDASRGATALRNVFLHMANPTSAMVKHLGFVVTNAEELDRAFEILDRSAYDLGSTLEMTDKRSVAGFNRMIRARVELKELVKQLDEASGALERMREEQLSATATAWDALTVSMKNFFNSFIGTGKIGNFFTQLRKDIDAITLNLSNMSGISVSSPGFGVVGYRPDTDMSKDGYGSYLKRMGRSLSWDTFKPWGLYDFQFNMFKNRGEDLRELQQLAEKEGKTWEAFNRQHTERMLETPTQVVEAMSDATAKNYKQKFKEAYGKSIESVLADSEAHKRNIEQGLVTDWRVIVDDALFEVRQETQVAIRTQVNEDTKFITSYLKNKEGLVSSTTGELDPVAVLHRLEAEGKRIDKDFRKNVGTLVDLGEAKNRILSATEIEKELGQLFNIDFNKHAVSVAKDTGGESAVERWLKFIEKVEADRNKAIAAQQLGLLKDEAKYYELVAKDAKKSSELRIKASEQWFSKEVQYIGLAASNEQVAHKESTRLQYMAARSWSSMNKEQVEEFTAWYDVNYAEKKQEINNKYALEYAETFQKVLRERVKAYQDADSKEARILDRRIAAEKKASRRRLKIMEDESRGRLAAEIAEREDGMGFMTFTEAERTYLEFATERHLLMDKIAEAHKAEARAVRELEIRQEALNALTEKRVMSEQEILNLKTNLQQSVLRGDLSEESHKTLIGIIDDSIDEGAMSIEDLQNNIEKYKLNVEEAKDATFALQAALKYLMAPTLKGDWGQTMTKAQKKALEKMHKYWDTFTNYFNQVADVIVGFYDVQIDNMEYAYNKETELIQKRYDLELERMKEREDVIRESREAGLLSAEEAAAQEKLLAEQREEREKQMEREKEKREEAHLKKKNEIERKAAMWNKAVSLNEIAQKTAIAIMNAAALPTPFDVLAIAAVSALGAAQTALIAAQPLPRYARGTTFHPGGLAIVGDGGRPEVIHVGRQAYVTPNRPTLVDIPRGSQVHPDLADYALGRLKDFNSLGFNRDSEIQLDTVLHSLTREGNTELTRINRNLRTLRANDQFLMRESMRQRITSKYK